MGWGRMGQGNRYIEVVMLRRLRQLRAGTTAAAVQVMVGSPSRIER